jgi:RNA polymerase sigma factor for flagellar operon FliA
MDSGAVGVERLYLDNLDLVERLSRFVCRSVRMVPTEIEDFSSHVKLKLFEDNYAILRKFQSRCSLASYLTIVIQRLLSDYRIHHFGRKWHTSAAASRLGSLATRLEVLLHRDQRTLAEAFAILGREGESVTLATLEQLAAHFPQRSQRPALVTIDDMRDTLAVSSESIETAAVLGDRLAACRTIAETLRDELCHLPPEDVTILRLHFYGGLSVADIARTLRREQKPLYKHIRKLCERFRARLGAAGIDGAVADDLIGRADSVFDFGLEEGGNPPMRPSPTEERGQRTEEPLQ